MIGVGDKLPKTDLMVITNDGPDKISSSEIFDGKKVVLFGLPGAFTGTCSGQHLPGYLENADVIKSKGIDHIVLVSVNDHYVMKAWADQYEDSNKIMFIADWNKAFTDAIGMEMDLSAGGLGHRSKRYSMIVENGDVKTLNIEETPGTAVTSGAAAILEQL